MTVGISAYHDCFLSPMPFRVTQMGLSPKTYFKKVSVCTAQQYGKQAQMLLSESSGCRELDEIDLRVEAGMVKEVQSQHLQETLAYGTHLCIYLHSISYTQNPVGTLPLTPNFMA